MCLYGAPCSLVFAAMAARLRTRSCRLPGRMMSLKSRFTASRLFLAAGSRLLGRINDVRDVSRTCVGAREGWGGVGWGEDIGKMAYENDGVSLRVAKSGQQ